MNEDEIEYPGVSDRIKSLLTDSFIMIGLCFVVGYLIKENGGAPNWVRVSAFVLIVFLYEPIMVAFFGGSIGHKMNELKVRKYNDHDRKIDIVSAIFRFAIKYVLGMISLLTVSGEREKRAIHDIGSGSIVLYSKKQVAKKLQD